MADAGTDAAPEVDAGPLPPPRGLSKGPFVQLLSAGRARLRFETRIDEPVGVRLTRAGGDETPEATRAPTELSYERDFGLGDVLPDVPGLHVVHEVLIEGLSPGERIEYVVSAPESEPVSGTFTAPVEPGRGFKVGWLADTSFPNADPTVGQLIAFEPDLVLHGGDITYQANPFDSWNGMMASMAPLMRSAPVHFAVGNHEFDNQMEISAQFDRLFAGQGSAGGTERYFAFTYGAVRFVMIDSETGALETMEDTQLAWLDAELEAASADPDIQTTIPCLHRPTYTLTRHAPGSTVVRDLLHAKFQTHGIPLVFAGHAHSYERFEVDGIQYVTDGGGGALLYDPNEEAAEVEMRRPGEGALRQAVERSYGGVLLDIQDDGGIEMTRVAAADGRVVDQITIAAPS